ncbi:MAG: hypothetical protein JWM39_540 [Parcubacteria group bacterium]|nr:hypothetical protein [Parcubacteria group bacterium]
MNKLLTLLSIAVVGFMLTACGTTHGFSSQETVGRGEYALVTYPANLPHVSPDMVAKNKEVPKFTVADWENLGYLDQQCRIQIPRPFLLAVKSVGTTALRTAIPTAIFGGYGTAKGIASVTTATKGYGEYAAKSSGGSAFGSGLGGGLDRHFTGNRYNQGQCVGAFVSDAKSRVGAFNGSHIIINADAVNGHAIKRPKGPLKPVPNDPNAVSTTEEEPPPIVH